MNEPGLLQPSLRGQRQPNIPEKTHQLGNQNQGGSIPALGVGMICKDTRVLCLNLQEGASLLFSVPTVTSYWWAAQQLPWGSPPAPRTMKSWYRAQRCDAPTHTKQCPPSAGAHGGVWPQRLEEEAGQVHVREDLGSDPTLPTELTTFLAGGMTKEQEDVPSPSTPLSVDPLWLPPVRAPQCCPTHLGGACTKVPAKPSAAQSWSQSWL